MKYIHTLKMHGLKYKQYVDVWDFISQQFKGPGRHGYVGCKCFKPGICAKNEDALILAALDPSICCSRSQNSKDQTMSGIWSHGSYINSCVDGFWHKKIG